MDPLITQSLVLRRLGESGQAITVLRRARRLQPDRAAVHYNEGLLLLGVYQRREAAAAAFERALALNPQDRLSREALARARGR